MLSTYQLAVNLSTLRKFNMQTNRLFNDGYNMPMKDKLKEWKETLDYLDSKHYKESKRRVEEVKKSVSETERLKKKVVKKGLLNLCSVDRNVLSKHINQPCILGTDRLERSFKSKFSI